MGAARTTARAAAWAVSGLVLALPLVAPGGPLGGRAALAGGALSVTGDVSGLQLGAAGALVVTVTNDDAAPVVVRALEVAVSGGGPCPDGLVVAPWRGALRVPAHGSATQVLTATVADDPACAGVAWQLGYTATA